MSYATLARKHTNAPTSRSTTPKSASGGLRIGDANDAFEQETDRAADGLTADRKVKRGWSFARMSVTAPQQRKTGLDQTTPSPADSGLVSLSQASFKLEQAQRNRQEDTLRNGPVQFRVPTTADMKALVTSGNVPVDVLKNRVQIALSRMAREKRLKTTDSVADIMKKVFPAAGGFDEAAYEDAVDVSDRTQVYQSVLDAETKVTAADKPKLKTTMGDAAKLIDDCVADSSNLASVFGSKKDTAKNVYKKAKPALLKAADHIDSNVTTDYNLDDPETGLGGWATFSDQKVHFEASVVKATDEKDAKITMIHESCHLADSSVDDHGYYGKPGFEHRPDAEKVTNAAHYEEIPRRKLDRSKYKDPSGSFLDFKPTPATETFEEKVKREASEYFRKAWDKAVDVHQFIRDIRIKQLAGNTVPFTTNKARILEVSKLMHLTVHEQPAASASVNQVDVVLTEGVAHAVHGLKKIASAQQVFNPLQLKMPPLSLGFKAQRNVLQEHLELKPIPGLSTGSLGGGFMPQQQLGLPMLQTVDEAVAKVIEDSIKANGSLVGSYDDDRKLLDWLVEEYGKDL